jgi:hypothetical protein
MRAGRHNDLKPTIAGKHKRLASHNGIRAGGRYRVIGYESNKNPQ